MNEGIGNFVFSVFLPGSMFTFSILMTSLFISDGMTHPVEATMITMMWGGMLYLGVNIARGLFLDFSWSQGRSRVRTVRSDGNHRTRTEPRLR